MKLLTQHLAQWASAYPDKPAFTFLNDGENEGDVVIYQELFLTSQSYANVLVENGLFQKPVLLLFPPGVEYIKAFLACLTAGVIAVPIYPPRNNSHSDRLAKVISDSGAKIILTTEKFKNKFDNFEDQNIQNCQILAFKDSENDQTTDFTPYQSVDNIAFIQYTSGSTGDPKGVVVTNRNLLTNEAQLTSASGQNSESIIVSWLPMYHDMGLIGNILFSVYLGAKCVCFAPAHFLQSPLKWLKALSKYKATATGAPNFAYDLLNNCNISDLDIDLSSVQIMCSGAEKVRHETVNVFNNKFRKFGLNPNALYPCYGLAEATLMVSGGQMNGEIKTLSVAHSNLNSGVLKEDKSGEVTLVSSGQVCDGIDLIILNNENQTLLDFEVGRICISGENVTRGYWNKEKSNEFFEINGITYFDTGDLGCLIKSHLYITGRKKEIIIKNGVNYYPYDIERIVTNSNSSLVENACAAFSVDIEDSERLVVAVELKRSAYLSINSVQIFNDIKSALFERLGLVPDDILLLSPMSLPKTSSGKIQRNLCKSRHLKNEFKVLEELPKSANTQSSVLHTENVQRAANRTELLKFIELKVNEILISTLQIDEEMKLHHIGLDSIKLMLFSAELEKQFDIKFELEFLYRDISITELIDFIKQDKNSLEEVKLLRTTTVNQEGLWFAAQNELNDNFIGFAFSVDDLSNATENIKNSLIKALDNLNVKPSNFFYQNGELNRVYNAGTPFEFIECFTISEYENRVDEIYESTLDFEIDQLIKVVAYTDSKLNKTSISFIVHHIISDGWSLNVLFDQWMSVLQSKDGAAQENNINQLLVDEARILNSTNLVSKALQLFKATVESEEINLLNYPVNEQVKSKAYATFDLDLKQVNKQARLYNVSAYTYLLGTYHMALSYLTSSTNICTVTPFANRMSMQKQKHFDYLVNLIYLKSEVAYEQSIAQYLLGLEGHFKNSLKYQGVPYFHLIKEAELDPETTQALGLFYFAYQTFEETSIFQKLFENANQTILKIDEKAEVKSVNEKLRKGNFKLELEIFESAENLKAHLKYSESHFNAAFVNGVIEIMNQFIYLNQPQEHLKIEAFEFLNAETIRNTLITSKGPSKQIKERHFLDLFEISCRKYPNNIAVQKGGEKLTYSELDQASNTVSNKLMITFGVNANERILLESSNRPSDLIAILGIFKAGAIYVPIDSLIPEKRKEFIINECDIRYCFSEKIQNNSEQLIIENMLSSGFAEKRVEKSDCAYIIYTSGTTGDPKGVSINHKGLVNLCYAINYAYQLDSSDSILQFASLSFDMSVEEIFPYWAVGAKVVMKENETINNLAVFKEYCEQNGITTLNLPTSYWEELLVLNALPKQIKRIAIGGEKLPLNSINSWNTKFGNQVRIFNAYGPTEYTVNATMKELDSKAVTEVTVGKPIINTSAFVLNFKQKILPDGVVGELVLTGEGMSDGYINKIKDDSFFNLNIPEVGTYKSYLTGDLAYKKEGGELVLLGRKDTQVKIRGFRIDLIGVESKLEQIEHVKRAVAVVHNDKLTAFVSVSSTEAFKEEEYREMVSKSLPNYMVPSVILELEKFPVNVRGKVDKKKLIALLEQITYEIVPPSTELEKDLFELWREMLDVNDFGITQSFFELGGHSIVAIKLVSRIESIFSVRISLKTIYAKPTIKDLSAYMETIMWLGKSKNEMNEQQDELFI